MTAEFAIILPVVVGILVIALGAGSAMWQHGRCAEAARSAARAAAVGEPSDVVTHIARQIAGDDARVVVSGGGEWVEVIVMREVSLIGTVSASVKARREEAFS